MVEKKEEDKTQEETKEPDSDNVENEEEINENQENTDTEETSEEENKEEDNLEKEIESLKEEKIRLLAEMENLRKRFEREKVETIKFGSINLARDILSPGDNLERALDALPEDENHPQSIKNLIDGLKMVLKEFKSNLEKHGVKKIETLNQKFDHNFHQAIMEVENDDVEEGTVVQEIQSGYTMLIDYSEQQWLEFPKNQL